MSKFLQLICAAAFTALAAASSQAGETARASNAVYVPSEAARAALFQQVKAKPCCWNRGQVFTTSPSTCRKYGGRIVAYEYCQRQSYGQWNNGGGYSGQPYNSQWGNGQWGNGQWPNGRWNNNYGGYNPEKPCCFNNGQYFNSTPKTCRKYGGQTVPQDYCAYAYGQGQGGYSQQPW